MEPTRIGGQGHADADAEQPPEGRVGTVPFWGEAAASINLVEVVQLIAPGSLSAPGCGGGPSLLEGASTGRVKRWKGLKALLNVTS